MQLRVGLSHFHKDLSKDMYSLLGCCSSAVTVGPIASSSMSLPQGNISLRKMMGFGSRGKREKMWECFIPIKVVALVTLGQGRASNEVWIGRVR